LNNTIHIGDYVQVPDGSVGKLIAIDHYYGVPSQYLIEFDQEGTSEYYRLEDLELL
jgi:hypothetical protein